MPIIEELASKDSVIFSDGFKSYDGIVDYGYKHHFVLFTAKMNSQKAIITSMELKIFGDYAKFA